MKKYVLFIIILLSLSTLVLSFPNASTQKSGELCERAHSFNYDYNFLYGQNLEIGKTYELNINFFISGSKIIRNPYKLSAFIISNGFLIDSNEINLILTKKINITPTKENPTLKIRTILILDGDDPHHRNYEAVYRDTFLLNNFIIKQDKSKIINSINKSINNTQKIKETIKSDNKIINKTIIKTKESIQSNYQIQVKEASKIPWYIVRIMGMLAFILFSIAMLFPILIKINSNFSFLYKYHCDISYFALILTFFHIINTIWDKYLWELSLKNILWFDFTSLSKIMISLGVMSFYLMIFIIISSFKKIRRVLKRKWYLIHVIVYPLYILIVIHSIFIGTDLNIYNLNNWLSILSFSIFWAFTLINVIFTLILFIKKLKNKLK